MLALASAGRRQRHVNGKVLELEQGIGGGAVAGRRICGASSVVPWHSVGLVAC